ncbi:MAG: nuclear transport factor 2 family protein [Akkermansiaceae bacterium]
MENTPLNQMAAYFSGLTPENVAHISERYAENVSFEDPMNRGEGLKDLELIFEDLFKQLKELKMEITAKHEPGALEWVMSYKFRGKQRTLPGGSFFEFDENGLVRRQRDYWDAGVGVYAEFPLLNLALRGIRKMVSVVDRG